MTIHDYIKAMLATRMWQEDSVDGLQGMTACGLVIRNRVRASWRGGDWLAVMAAHDEYAGFRKPASLLWPDIRDPQFQAVLWKVEPIYDGTEIDITDGALWYANLSVASDWFVQNIVQKTGDHQRIGTIGRQTFFR